MKKQLALCIAFFCSFGVVAQDAVYWSAPLTELSYRVRDIIFFKDHSYVLRVTGDGLAGKKNKSILQQLDNHFNYQKELEIKLMYEKKKAEPRQLIALNDKLYLLYTGYTNKEEILLLSEIDTDSLNFTGTPVILGKVRIISGHMLMEQSRNGRFLSVFAFWKHEGDTKASIVCYDDNLQRIYEDEKSFNLKYSYKACSQLEVDDDGNTFVLLQEYFSIVPPPPSPPIFWQRYRSGENIVSKVIDKKNKYLIQKARVVVSDEVVLLAGYFTEQEFKDDRVKGISFMAYDKAAKGAAKQVEVPAPKDIAKYIEKTTRRKYNESEAEIPALTILDIKDWEGHGYVVVGERYYPHNEYLVKGMAFISLVDYSLSEVKWTIPVCKYYDPSDFTNDLHLALEADKVNVFFNSNDHVNKDHDEAHLYGNGFIQMKITPEGANNTRVLCGQIGKMEIDPKRRIISIDRKSWLVVAGQSYKEELGIIRQ